MSRPRKYERMRARRGFQVRYEAKIVIAIVVVALVIFSAVIAFGRWYRTKTALPSYTPDVACLSKVILPDEQPEIMVDYTGFTVSFNPAYHIPNYVVWELTGREADGELPRNSKFYKDNDVYGCAELDDYRRSGFDRGHMAPAGDMKWSADAMAESHSLVNICPQDHSVNSGRWSTLEKMCRQWAQRDSALLIICGPVITDEMPRTIGRSQVRVPERFFKVVMAPFAETPRAIGFIIPNSYTDEGLEAMSYTVDDVEQITGYDFFSCIPDSIESRMEGNADFRQWTQRGKHRKQQ